HLHVVPGAVGPDVRAARRAVDDRGDRREDLLDLGIRSGVAARHDARPEQRTLLATRHPDPHEPQPALGALLRAALGVGEVRAAVRLWTATGVPRRAMLRARFAPITASPVTPMRLVLMGATLRQPWLRAPPPRG